VVGLALKITEGEPALNDVALPFFPRIIHEKSHQPAAEPRIFYFKRIGVLMQSSGPEQRSAWVFGALG
jgi:hypothetical protein